MDKIYAAIFFILILSMFNQLEAKEFERESFYSNKLCADKFRGKPTRTSEGLYVDCETSFAVIEFDWAKRPKNYECMGQALVYAYQTGKVPVCVLLTKTDKEMKFALGEVNHMNSAGIKYIILDIREF